MLRASSGFGNDVAMNAVGAAASDVGGNLFSFDAFGRRRHGANWTETLTTLTNTDTTRGYTGHEMLDSVRQLGSVRS